MKFNFDIDYSLYLVTDSSLMSTPTLEQAVEQAIDGGATIIQLREKHASSRKFFETAVKVKAITKSCKIPLIINDRVDIALAVNADGVHVGQKDLPSPIVRKILGYGKIIGVSVSSVKEAIDAEESGADYLGVGAMFATTTKMDADLVTIEKLKLIRKAVSLPMVVIGGINENTIPLFTDTGINGIAVVSALISARDISKKARELKQLFYSTK